MNKWTSDNFYVSTGLACQSPRKEVLTKKILHMNFLLSFMKIKKSEYTHAEHVFRWPVDGCSAGIKIAKGWLLSFPDNLVMIIFHAALGLTDFQYFKMLMVEVRDSTGLAFRIFLK